VKFSCIGWISLCCTSVFFNEVVLTYVLLHPADLLSNDVISVCLLQFGSSILTVFLLFVIGRPLFLLGTNVDDVAVVALGFNRRNLTSG
jgi:hypothetical protein